MDQTEDANQRLESEGSGQSMDLPEERNRILCIVSSLQIGDGTLFQIVAGAQPVIISWR